MGRHGPCKEENDMKKLISVLLAAVIFFSVANIALAETTTAAAPKYTLTNVNYDGHDVTGTVVHTDGTPVADKIKVRVTFYIIGNYYMATTYTVKEDGTFKITGVGPIQYITVIANSITDNGTTRLDAKELFVTAE
jgi:hypothetical protein